MNHDVTPIGVTNWRNENKPFGIKDRDRLGHIYVIGKTGVGKSTLLMNMAISDIQKGKGLAVIDPHGDISQNLLKHIPDHRLKDVVFINPSDLDNIIPYNPLKGIKYSDHHLVASGVISTFKKLWWENWGPRMEHILRFTLLALLEYPNGSLLDIQPMLTNPDFRKQVLTFVQNESTQAFWYKEFDKYSPMLRAEAVSPILNKIGLFVTCIPLREMVGPREDNLNMRKVMDEGKILIANLSKGIIGEDASTLIGSMLVTAIQLSAMQRATTPEQMRRPFYLYVDEAHSFLSLSFADIMAEARKYGLSLFMAHQYIEQMHEKIRSAIFGNVGTMIVFRVGANDAEYLAKEFYPEFDVMDMVSLPRYHMYLKLMIDGVTSRGFSAKSKNLK